MKKVYLSAYLCLAFSSLLNAQWSLSGNAISSGNFLGTTNTQNLIFKANNTQVGYLSYGSLGNVAFGLNSGNTGSALCCNVAVGYYALNVNTSGNNTAIGHNALLVNTSGGQNTAVGSYNSYKITTGSWNTSVGSYANQNITTGSENCSYGQAALRSLVTGSANNAFGVGSLDGNTASNNNAFGYFALYSNTSGTPNSAFGHNAAYGNTTGSNNVAMGNSALYYNTTGSQNTAVGANAGPGSGSTNLTNSGAFGYGATVTSSNTIVFGNSSVSTIGAFANWTNFSDGRYKKNIKEEIPGLAFIKLLHPVTYNLDATGIEAVLKPEKLNSLSQSELIALKQKEQIKYSGFIAQEVEGSARQLGFEFSGVKVPQSDKDFYGLRYGDFVVPLVKAVQELSSTNDSLRNIISDLTSQISKIHQELNKLRSSSITGDIPVLKQNAPNPFSNSSLINYYLPSRVRQAVLTITDAQGKVLKNVSLKNTKGQGQAIVNANALPAGIYHYSLVVNGKQIDTKTMVLAK